MSQNNHLAGPARRPVPELPTMTTYRKETYWILRASGATRKSPLCFNDGHRFLAAKWLYESDLCGKVGRGFYIP